MNRGLSRGKTKKSTLNQLDIAGTCDYSMEAAVIIEHFQEWGVGLIANGDKLTVESSAPLADEDYALILDHKADILAILTAKAPRRPVISSKTTPAESLVGTCRRLGISLRLDSDGTLVVGKTREHAPASLVRALSAHAEAVARLVQADDSR